MIAKQWDDNEIMDLVQANATIDATEASAIH